MCSFSRLPSISKCCCFISLRSGGYLIGLMQFVFGLALMIYLLFNPLVENRDSPDENQNADSDSPDQEQENAFLTEFYIFVVVSCVFILLGVLLVLGVRIKSVLLVKLYIVFEIILLLVGLIIYAMILLYFILAFAIAASDTTNFLGDFIKLFATIAAQALVVLIFISFAVIVLMAYFLICVSSYLKELIQLTNGTPQAVAYTAVTEKDNTKE